MFLPSPTGNYERTQKGFESLCVAPFCSIKIVERPRVRHPQSIPRPGCTVAMLTLPRLLFTLGSKALLMAACPLSRPSRPGPSGAFRSLDRRARARGADRVGSEGMSKIRVSPKE